METHISDCTQQQFVEIMKCYIKFNLLFLLVLIGIYISIWTHTIFEESKNVKERKGTLEENRTLDTSKYRSKLTRISSILYVNASQHMSLGNTTTPLDRTAGKSNKDSSNKGLFCTIKSNWNSRYFSKVIKSNFSSWTYKEKAVCPKLNISKQILNIRPKLTFSLQCEGKKFRVIDKKILSNKVTNDNVFRVKFGDHCLAKYINSCCKDTLPIPNVVHYVRYWKGKLKFFEFVSFISVIRFVRPCMILIHGDALPIGEYWNFILTLSPNIVHVKREPPEIIFGKIPEHKEHAGDIMRIEALLLYGGIYLDTDTVIVKSLTPLRKYPCTMSLQSSGYMSSAFVMAEQNATFLQKWLDGYKYDYQVEKYVYNAMVYPKLLAKEFKELIHVDYGKLSRPWKQTGYKLYYTNCIWKGIFGIHLFSRSFDKRSFMDVEIVKHFNSTVGSICRHILYGNKALC